MRGLRDAWAVLLSLGIGWESEPDSSDIYRLNSSLLHPIPSFNHNNYKGRSFRGGEAQMYDPGRVMLVPLVAAGHVETISAWQVKVLVLRTLEVLWRVSSVWKLLTTS